MADNPQSDTLPPSPNPRQQYLKAFGAVLKSTNGRITANERDLLERERIQLGLSREESSLLERQVEQRVRQLMQQAPPGQSGTSDPTRLREDLPVTPATPDSAETPDADYSDRLARYQQEFGQVASLQFPLSEDGRRSLQDLQQALQLSDRDVQPVETNFATEMRDQLEAQHQKLQWYEEEFRQAVDSGAIDTEEGAHWLATLQHNLALPPEVIQRLERRVLLARIKTMPFPVAEPSSAMGASEPNRTAAIALSADPIDLLDESVDWQAVRAFDPYTEKTDPASTEPSSPSPQAARYYQLTFAEALSHSVFRPTLPKRLWEDMRRLQTLLNLPDSDARQAEEAVRNAFDRQQLEKEQQWLQAQLQTRKQRYKQAYAELANPDLLAQPQVRNQLAQLQADLGVSSEEVMKIQQEVLLDKWKTSTQPPHPSDDDWWGEPGSRHGSSVETHIEEPTSPPGLSTDPPPTGNGRSTLAGGAPPTVIQPPPTKPPKEYRGLENALRNKDWKRADQETLELLLTATDRQLRGWMDVESIDKIPCDLLAWIDKLWLDFSKGRFGFQMQRLIYDMTPPEEAAFSLSSDTTYGQALAFSKEVGWWQERLECHKRYDSLSFSLNDAPEGQFPALWYWQIPWHQAIQFGGLGGSRAGCRVDATILAALMKRLKDCDIPKRSAPPPAQPS